jgi:hypothetical protein
MDDLLDNTFSVFLEQLPESLGFDVQIVNNDPVEIEKKGVVMMQTDRHRINPRLNIS